MKQQRILVRSIVLMTLLALSAQGEGPLYVGGPPDIPTILVRGTTVPGLPFKWTVNPVTYWTDQGQVGTQSKAQADALVLAAFKAWEDVPTATIAFGKAGDLAADITGSNVLEMMDDLFNCAAPIPAGSLAKDRVILYDDVHGNVIRALGGDPNLVAGTASPTCLEGNGQVNFFNRGFAILNGVGIYDASNLELLKFVMIHEFGHLVGLDHSQLNGGCLWQNCGPGKGEGLPTMLPFIALPDQQLSLAPDDIVGVSELYPESSYATSTGKISGRVLFSDGVTPAQGFNVIARLTSDPGGVAVSTVSGYLFTTDAGNPFFAGPLFFSPSPFGTRDPSLIGYFEIPGLSPGEYTLEVEAVSRYFIWGSSVGPIGPLGFQFPWPNDICYRDYWDVSESNLDLCDAKSTITVTAGATSAGYDVILDRGAPTYDAWEGN